METTERSPHYRVWGRDKVAYGPLDLPTLIQWIKDARVTMDSSVLVESENQWHKITEVPELKGFFSLESPISAITANKNATSKPSAAFAPGALRRIRLFDTLEEPQLESFLHYMKKVVYQQFSHIVRQGERGDAMYLVVEGEVRTLAIVEGKETTLATISPGGWFGEISLLDQGPRSADVIANKDSALLKLSSEAFERLLREAPVLAMPFLLALCRMEADRVRRTSKRYEDSIRYIRTATPANVH